MRIDASLRERWLREDEGWRFELPEGWQQGRSVFGGLTAAALAALGARQVDEDRRLRTANLQLMRPVTPGTVRGAARVLREGRGAAFVETRLAQGGAEAALAQLVFVRPREPSLALPSPPPPLRVDPETLEDLPYVPGVVPEFVQHAQLRWAQGSPPFSGGAEARFAGFCRLREPAGDAEGLLAMLDLWPSPTLGLLDRFAFASTVSWTAHLLGAPARFDGWFQFEYEAVAARAGFHTVVGRLFDPSGELVGWTEQLVAVFD